MEAHGKVRICFSMGIALQTAQGQRGGIEDGIDYDPSDSLERATLEVE